MLPEVGDLQRSSDVAEPSLMSHRPAAEITQFIQNQANQKEPLRCSFCQYPFLLYHILPLHSESTRAALCFWGDWTRLYVQMDDFHV